MYRLGFQSLLITRRDNFAWLSCGGNAVTSYRTHTSPVFLLLTPTRKYAIGYNMDLPRTADEELEGLEYEPLSLSTLGKTPIETALKLATGKLAADDHLAGAENIQPEIVRLYEPYTPTEMARYREVARESAQIIHELACLVVPGMTERQVLGAMWGKYLEHGFEGNCMFVSSDERIQRYRHPVPCSKRVEKVVLLAPAVSKHGLHVIISRFVFFGEPPEELRQRQQDVSTMQAALAVSAQPGVKLVALRQLCLDLFEQLGYPEERGNHVHGGPTGYLVSMPERCQDPQEVVCPNTALGWYITVRGAKSEEVLLIDEQGSSLITAQSPWPMLAIEYSGKTIQIPDVLVR